MATEVYPNERFLNQPVFAGFAARVLSANAHPVVGAWDDKGRDVSTLLRTRDHQYVRDFTNLPFAGFANQHTLTLDVGEWTPANPLRLLLHGFIEYFSASSMYAAWQAENSQTCAALRGSTAAGRQLEEGHRRDGLPCRGCRASAICGGSHGQNFRQARAGIPAATTNLQIYWDQALIDNGPDAPQHVRQTELPLAPTLCAACFSRQPGADRWQDAGRSDLQLSAHQPDRALYPLSGQLYPLRRGHALAQVRRRILRDLRQR